MQSLLLLSSRRWVCALSGSVRGRISEFRDALHHPSSLVTTRCAGGDTSQLDPRRIWDFEFQAW
jgi:hypothetical protein